MTHDRSDTSFDQPRPPEVQQYGPPPSREPYRAPAAATPPPTPSAPQPVRRGPGAAGIVAVALVAGIVSGSLSAVAVNNLMASRPATVSPTGQATTVTDVTIDESSAVITAVGKVAPAVVTIQSTIGGAPGATGSGSGFIYDAGGFILTNKHVVADASSLTVILDDGRTFPGTVYGIDPLTDLAIVTIKGDELPAAPIGSSEALEPGQLAIAIGNPLGNYENTVTTGVVSGIGRQIRATSALQNGADVLRNLIQTDAAINPGNSGGPLINSAGQVIGINTAINEDAEGIGFSIPIDVAKPIMAQAVAGQKLVRPWIGVYYTPITRAMADAQHLPVNAGALVGTSDGTAAVFPGSPAEQAGLQSGDIIITLNDKPVTADDDLSLLVLPYAPGDTITLGVLRDGAQRDLQVTLGELPVLP